MARVAGLGGSIRSARCSGKSGRSCADHWPAQYAAEAAESGFEITDVEDAGAQVRAFIAEIDAAQP
jgi:hypothetical protein